jgi:hypothetical protein
MALGALLMWAWPAWPQGLAEFQACIRSQSPAHYFKLDGDLADATGNAPDFAVAGTGGGFTNDFFGNPAACRFFVNNGDALVHASDLIPGGGPAGGDASATDRGSLALLFRTLDAATNTGQRFVFSQGNTTANANALGLFFENNSSSDPNALKLRVGNLTTTLLAASNLAPAAWYYFAMTWDEARNGGEVFWFLGRANGVLNTGVVDLANAAVVGDNGPFYLGNRSTLDGGFRLPGQGRVDELAIWNRELSAGEIQAQFDALRSTALHPLWLAYMAAPDTCTNLPNCSFAGYQCGERPIPEAPTNVINVKAPPYNAVGDGVADDTAAIRAALAAVSTNGATVYFPDGIYNCSGVLFVHTDRTVLRGQSRTNTILRFTRSLTTGYAPNTSGDSSRWSWTGGMIMFCPQSKNTYLSSTNDIGATWSDGWTVGAQLTTITGTHLRGSRTVTVTSAAALSPGQLVFISIDNVSDLSVLKHYCGDEAWAQNYDWSSTNSGAVLPANRPRLDWPVEIAAVSNNVVTLRQPLRMDLRAAWNPRIRAAGAVLRECGLENLTIHLARDYEYIYALHHNKEPGWNGPWFNNAIHCWVRGVTVVDPDNGFLTSAAKNITFTDIKLDYSAPNRRAHHHGTVARASTHDCLWENFHIATEPRHGIEVESFSAGNVWSKGVMDFGTFDSHKALPYECLRTEIVVNNTGTAGGSSDAGPRMGARFAHWNVLVTTNRNHMIGEADLMPRGAIVGVRGCAINDPVHPVYGDSRCVVDLSGLSGEVPRPANLYEAQRALRLGLPPAITAIAFTPAGVTLSVQASDAFVYRVEAATNLAAPVTWTVLASNLLANSGGFAFTDTNAPVAAQRFYRIVR